MVVDSELLCTGLMICTVLFKVKEALKPVKDTGYASPDLVPEVDTSDTRRGELNGNFCCPAETAMNRGADDGKVTDNPMYDSGDGIAHVELEEAESPRPCDSPTKCESICFV